MSLTLLMNSGAQDVVDLADDGEAPKPDAYGRPGFPLR